ncbi:putative BOI-related E3 ubiquitin-protein ligase 2-like [Hibiscus syriacus]|uniref:Prostaglandin E synthase 2 n=1 Tax=Hibiscus syriacus TaxID=106335 RepID=A0A6A2ZZ11_HIBSY|nr:prostaglandin E synthase 2-like [Hibiscus syriacus]KAE8696786.1 putative BOI-related E3 ubiquitin-protein ligase 2-like [Hibiscus syriacus]
MRRVNGLATLSRALSCGGGVGAANEQRLVQAALMSTCSSSSSNSHIFSQKFAERLGLSSSSLARSVAGTMLFSAAASSLAQDALAKEKPPSEKFLPKEVVLYQYEACPFCNKVKAFLDYYNIPYKIVEVNPISKKEIKWSDYKKVPILKVDHEQMVDSSDIIDKLFLRINPDSSIPDGEEKKWREWVDNHLVHVLSPNIYRSTSEALESFDYITTHGNFSFTERLVAKYAGAAAMYFVSKKLKKKHNITDERAALYEAAETWVDALKGRHYLGGSKPNLADLAVFGVLRPIRYLTSGKDMVEHTRIGDWYSRMENAVGEPARIKE